MDQEYSYSTKVRKYIRKHPVKTIIFGSILLMLISLGIYIHNEIQEFNDSFYKDGTDMIVTDLGDEFYIEYTTSYFKKYRTDYRVFVDDNSSSVVRGFYDREEYRRPEVTVLINNENERCYAFNIYDIVYRVNNEAFKGFEITSGFLDDYYKDEEVIKISKDIISNNDWSWFDIFAEYLVDNNDADTIAQVIRYSEGDISDEEIETKSADEYDKEYVMKLSQQLIEKYNLINDGDD